MKSIALVRVFNFNGLSLPDPGADNSPQQVKEIFTAIYPDLTSAEIEGPEQKNGKLVYTFRRAVGTKG